MSDNERQQIRARIRDRFLQAREELKAAADTLDGIANTQAALESRKAAALANIDQELQSLNAAVLAGNAPAGLAEQKANLAARLKAVESDFAAASDVLRRERDRLVARQVELESAASVERENAELFSAGNPELLARHAILADRASWADTRRRATQESRRLHAADPKWLPIAEDAVQASTIANGEVAASFAAIIAE